jgi:hypothetical protein
MVINQDRTQEQRRQALGYTELGNGGVSADDAEDG